ncbi:OmpA family protein [Flavisolibacter ginsenosidimutans]|uniref:OmpA family protein n=1 Tax=Flavisolibacter ginsenosidimutans TaxID=661481 RepID=A0A5B8UFG0_9BACT|nr:OmpA family protein [Flavisolibacter ginsenosidimutans]QEC55046.1 OmpA family protein [Flavisolibacter ginsenosidimutans]
MKKLLGYAFVLTLFAAPFTPVNAQGILGKIKQKVKDKAEQKEDEKIDKAVDKAADGVDNATKNGGSKGSDAKDNNVKQVSNIETGNNETPSLKVYQNYDFVPGDKILFEDNFTGDQDGEFPSHWELEKGQGQLNKVSGQEALFLTEGNYARVKPRMKTEKYLTEPFTIEFDYYNKDRAYGILTFLSRIDPACNCETTSDVQVGASEASFNGVVDFSKAYPAGLQDENFVNKWHHIAIAVKNHQLKLYVDQNRILVVPDTKSEFFKVGFGGIGSEEQPLIFKNVRIASGGDMNMIGKKFTESKIITHGINFDIDKASIKPESMGTLNMIVGVLKENPDLKFSIEGHTDNSGTAAHNLTLSQQRAEAVKVQLIAMGVDGSRLSTKGLGDTKPISDNNSLEGKANNRRVEFVKM